MSVRIGVVGVGHMGRYHVNLLSMLPSADLRGVFDVDTANAAAVAQRYGVVSYDSVQELLSNVDAVCIAVPTEQHFSVACEALKAGVHVLLEKPIATSVADAATMIDLARKKSLLLQIGHIERFNGAIRQVAAIVENPYLVEARRLAPYNPRIQDAGVVLDLMIHDLDIVTNLIGDEVAGINAFGAKVKTQYEDIANAQLCFQNGCIANLTASRVTPEKIRTLAVSQESGYLLLDYDTQAISIHRQTGQEYDLKEKEIRYRVAAITEKVFVHTVNPLQQELAHFIDCITGREEPLVSNTQDLRTLETALRVVAGIHGNR